MNFAFLFSLVLTANAAPLSSKLVDMTHVFDATTLNWPGDVPFQENTYFSGTPDGELRVQSEEIFSSTHAGTHMDAPAHASLGGLPIDKILPRNLIAPASVVDITSKAELDPDAEVTVEDLLQWESTTGQSLNGTILLLRSGWGHRWNNRTAYLGTSDNDITKLHFPGLAGDAALWLVLNREIVGIGTEAVSFDVGRSRLFMAHRVLLGYGIFGLENIANMDQLPIYGATLYVMPMKISNASGAPTRIIARFPKVMF